MTRDELLAIIDQAAHEGWTELDLRDEEITELPPEIGKLAQLKKLYVGRTEWWKHGKNALRKLPPEIGKLNNLKQLNLSGNQLVSLPPEVGQLCNLERLHVSGNELTTVPQEVIRLSNLRWLNLNSNSLTIIPTFLLTLERLEKLRLYNNPLPLPPELVGNWKNPGDPKAILDAYFQASRPLHEAKLLLVGEGDVGKTAIINRLLRDCFFEKRSKTVGVDIHQWKCEIQNAEHTTGEDELFDTSHFTLRINIWDFGGQEIYHATHQFFLTHRSLYLLVLDATKDEEANRLEYWLRHVQSFAGNAPVIVVANKSDQHRLVLDERGLMLKYPSIQAIIHTSCITGEGIPHLRQAIEAALATIPHINDWVPLTWFAVKEKLEIGRAHV